MVNNLVGNCVRLLINSGLSFQWELNKLIYLQVYTFKLIIVKMNRSSSFVLKRMQLWKFSGKFVVYVDNNNLNLC